MAQYTFNELNTLTGSLNRLRKEYPILAFIFAERLNKWEFDNKAAIDVLRVESNRLYQECIDHEKGKPAIIATEQGPQYKFKSDEAKAKFETGIDELLKRKCKIIR